MTVQTSPNGRRYYDFRGYTGNNGFPSIGITGTYGIATDSKGYIYVSADSTSPNKVKKVGTGQYGTTRGQIIWDQNVANGNARNTVFDYKNNELIIHNGSTEIRRVNPDTGALLGTITQPRSYGSIAIDPMTGIWYCVPGSGSASTGPYECERVGNTIVEKRLLSLNSSVDTFWGFMVVNGVFYFADWNTNPHAISVYEFDNPNPNGTSVLKRLYTATALDIKCLSLSFLPNEQGNTFVYVGDHTNTTGVRETTINGQAYNWIVAKPGKSSLITVPTTARVGQTASISWNAVPLPTQPSGVTLDSNTVYYEVAFWNGSTWISITNKTSATSVNYVIPTMADTIEAKVRVRAFVESYSTKHFGDYQESKNITIYNNNIPTVPLAFSAPLGSTRYRAGFNYTVSWGASTDLDNDPITYQLDFFNGSSWSTIASGLQTTNRSFVVPSGPDTLNAQFRVRSYDGRDYSGYRLSDKFEVFNNTPPNTPRPFTLPESDEMRIIDLQTAYTVSWGPADVEVGETAKYEVSFRGSPLDNWVIIQDINNPNSINTSMQHILPNIQDSDTAQYRVRAYDGIEFGGYTESNQFSISGNKVTNTSGFNQELMDRMAIGQEVRLSWQPAQTARGTGVVYDIEIFDGFTWNEVAYNVPTTSLVFRIPSMEDTPYAKIRIRSKTPFQYGGYVESNWSETSPFTIVNFFIFDTIAVPFLNDVQKKENADYLRQKVNDMRIVNDLAPLVYTDPVIIRYETAIRAVHFDELERGILECFDTNPRASFGNARTEQEMRKIKEYVDQAELIQELPQRIDFICKALMNQ